MTRRNSGTRATTLATVPDDQGDLPPVCSCCKARALRASGTGVVCPDCDRADERVVDIPERHPPDGTTGGV